MESDREGNVHLRPHVLKGIPCSYTSRRGEARYGAYPSATAPALATADVGIAIGAGTDVAIESAGIVLVVVTLATLCAAIELSRATYKQMIQNLIWRPLITGGHSIAGGLSRPLGGLISP